MMNTHSTSTGAAASDAPLRAVRKGSVVALGSAGGRLDVVRGFVWLTRSGDPEDHLLGVGQSVRIPPSGRVLIEGWADEPALVDWQPENIGDRLRGAVRGAFGRAWEIVGPAHRVGAGVAAALVAVLAGALLFGPLSESRTRTLLGPTLLHNGAGARISIGLAAGTSTGSPQDRSAGPRERARVAAQEARRRPAGAA
jgi:hypothetical protein